MASNKPIRILLGNDRGIIESGLLYEVLFNNNPDLSRFEPMISSLIQLHLFNITSLGVNQRDDNLMEKNITKFEPIALTNQDYDRNSLSKEYFNGKVFTRKDAEKLFNLFKPREEENLLLDDVLYQAQLPFFISREGFINYLTNKLNTSFDIWRSKKHNTYQEIKIQLLPEEIFNDEEQKFFNVEKNRFLKLIGVVKNLYSSDLENINPTIESEVKDIASTIIGYLSRILLNLRSGRKKHLVTKSISQLKKIPDNDLNENVRILIRFFDDTSEEKLIYTFLARRLEKFYNLVLGKFYRIVLPVITSTLNLNRSEIRFYIFINIPLRIFNHNHPLKTNIIQHFYDINEKFSDKFMNIIILRNRRESELKEYETLFYSYLKTYQVMMPLIREFDKEKKRILRNPDRYSDSNLDIEAIGDDDKLSINEIKHRESAQSEEESPISNNNKTKKSNDTDVNVKPKKKPLRDPHYVERKISEIEVDDFLDSLGFNDDDKFIIQNRAQGAGFEEIGQMLKPKKSKQAIQKRFDYLKPFFPPVETTLKILE